MQKNCINGYQVYLEKQLLASPGRRGRQVGDKMLQKSTRSEHSSCFEVVAFINFLPLEKISFFGAHLVKYNANKECKTEE